mmetsp:Transcript_2574/g.4512  ORF Transcript_2574/g.4512 Transcript_2574/m.4512 type:complete len:95 (-) Transcript_2574:539-823(-)
MEEFARSTVRSLKFLVRREVPNNQKMGESTKFAVTRDVQIKYSMQDFADATKGTQKKPAKSRGARTRSSMEACAKSTEQDDLIENYAVTTDVPK